MERKKSRSFLARWQSSLWSRATGVLTCLLFINSLAVGLSPVPQGKPDSYPKWWFEQDVIPRVDSSNSSPTWNTHDYHAPDDYAAANLGQLKYFATKAAAELDVHLPNGAGSAVHDMVNQWTAAPADGVVRDDSAVLNIGQLKYVAKPFWERLIAERYTNAYPWDAAGQPPDDWSVANLGQIKFLFSFELTKSTANDGLPDWWVLGWGLGEVNDANLADADFDGDGYSNLYEFLHGTDPTDFYNGQQVTLTVVSGDNQSGLPGAFLANPIVISATKANGDPWANAPIIFSADNGLGVYSAANDGSVTPQSTFKTQTGTGGQVAIYFQPAASTTGSGYAAAGANKISFKLSGYDPDSAPSSAPVLTTSSSTAGQSTLTWSSNSTNGTGTDIQRWTYGTGWVTIGSTTGQTSTFTDTAVPGNDVVAYRVVTTNGNGASSPSPFQSSDGSDLRYKDTDHDGLSDAEEVALGTNPKNPDTDGDGVIDGKDLDPLDRELTQPRVPQLNYAVIDLTALGFTNPRALNDSLEILDLKQYWDQKPSRIWKHGQFSDVPTPQGEFLYYLPCMSNAGELLYRSNPTDFGVWSAATGFTPLTYTTSDVPNFDPDWFAPDFITLGGVIAASFIQDAHVADPTSYAGSVLWSSASADPVRMGDVFTIAFDDSGNQTRTGDWFRPGAANDTPVVLGFKQHGIYDGGHTNALWQGGAPMNLSSADPTQDWADSINNSNPPIAVGSIGPCWGMWAQVGSQWVPKAVAASDGNGGRIAIPGLPYQVNDRCEIIGESWDADGNRIGRLWQNGQLFNLESRTPTQDYNDFYPYIINNNGAMLAYATRASDGHDVVVLLVPVELMVDGNRDGKMDANDASVQNVDRTTADRPFRFWINDDQDMDSAQPAGYWSTSIAVDGETVPVTVPDYKRDNILTKRDLEDWTRLWINAQSIAPMLAGNSEITAALQFKPITGDKWPAGTFPSIKFCRAYESDGGIKYLADDTVAGDQISGEYDVPVEDSNGRSTVDYHPFTLPNNFWADLDQYAPKHFLFEGVTKGQGKLVLVFYHGNTKIGESGPLYLDLKEVRRMYERGKIPIEANQIADPWNDDHPQIPDPVPDPWKWQPEVDPYAEAKTVVYVHGWRMSYTEDLTWADTTFKRLWQMGYKGRFYSFRWPTFSGFDHGIPYLDPIDYFVPGSDTYNASEYRAWLSGQALSDFVNGLPNKDRCYLLAHSMGNVVVGSALLKGMQVKRYAMCNSAMAGMAYNGGLEDEDYATPDTDQDPQTRETFGLANKLSAVATTIVNFNLGGDHALGVWDLNNQFFKPDHPSVGDYSYADARPSGQKLLYTRPFHSPRPITSIPEAMGYVTQARSHAGGEYLVLGNSVTRSVNMGHGGYEFGTEHSAEWEFTIQKTYAFWRRVATEFNIDVGAR